MSKVNQDERKRLNELREISEKMIVKENYKLICSSQSRLCLKEHIKPVTKSKERFKNKCIQQIDETNNWNIKFKCSPMKSCQKNKRFSDLTYNL